MKALLKQEQNKNKQGYNMRTEMAKARQVGANYLI